MKYLNPSKWTALGYLNATLTVMAVALVIMAVKS